MVDSTFTPPPFYRPLADGADLVVHSLTKYVNGHGDAMGGAVIGRSELIEPIKADAMVDVGGVISPFNAWMLQRGSVTLPLRLRQHFSSAQNIAEFLEADRRVAFVAYPGLPSHPGHDVARRQFVGRGFGGTSSGATDTCACRSGWRTSTTCSRTWSPRWMRRRCDDAKSWITKRSRQLFPSVTSPL